ncbi:MAG: TolC family protein [Muribaculaceae bacterium]|nr:TolC family protein [Muribaculaceae bacterium]
MRLKITILALCGIATFAYGQKTYTLEECSSMAIEHNIKMKKAFNDVKSAEQMKKEAFTNYFPTISASGVGYNANKGLLELNLGEGMEMSMLKNGLMGGITATQPIFAGGQIINSNNLAKVGLEVSKLQQKLSENEVVYTTEQYYWQIVTIKEKLKTIVTLELMLDNLCKDVEASVNAGITTRNNLLQAQLKKNEIESNRMNLENNLSLCKMILAQYVGIEDSLFDVETVVNTDNIPLFPEQLRRDHQSSLRLIPEYNMLEKNVEANRLQQKIAVGKNLPTVGVGAGYMYDNLMDKGHSFGMVFASVSIPLSGWWGGSYAIKKQKIQVRNAEDDLKNSSDLLVIKMQKSWNDLSDAYKQMVLSYKSINQATENLRLNQDYYKAGTISMSDLLDAQSLFQQSRDKYVDSYSQYQIKTLEYLQATGQ